MNLNVDLGTALVAAGMSTSAIIAYVWLKIGPIEKTLEALIAKFMTQKEIELLIDKKISEHEKDCKQEHLAQTSAMRLMRKG
jgi:hypothetical protein